MKYIFIKKRQILIFLLATVIFALSVVLVKTTNTKEVFYGGNLKELPIYSVERDDNKIAISFDCAWGVDYTDKLLSILKDEEITCTFFAVEFWADKYGDYLKKIVDNGHEVGTHSSTHPKMSLLDKNSIEKELLSSKNKIEEITGKQVQLFRAPFGDYNDTVIKTATDNGLYTIQWDVDSLDWKEISAKEIAQRVINKTKSGSIVLFHNQGTNTTLALPEIIKSLKNKGYIFFKISDLIYKENYKILPNGRQIKNG